MEFLTTGVMNLSHKVENIELQVEIAIVGVLKEVFDFNDGSAPPKQGFFGAAIHSLDPGVGRNEELGMPPKEALGEFNPESCR